MAFLFARCTDGSIRHFEKAELAFFFSDSSGKPYVHGGRTFVKYEIIVFGSLEWFKGTVDVHDYANDSPSENAFNSMRFPITPHAKLELPAPPSPEPVSSANPFPKVCPTMGTAEASFYIFSPTGPFFEITEYDALKWLYQHLGHVPRRAHAAFEKVRRASMACESAERQNLNHQPVGESERDAQTRAPFRSPNFDASEGADRPIPTSGKTAKSRKPGARGNTQHTRTSPTPWGKRSPK